MIHTIRLETKRCVNCCAEIDFRGSRITGGHVKVEMNNSRQYLIRAFCSAICSAGYTTTHQNGEPWEPWMGIRAYHDCPKENPDCDCQEVRALAE